MAQDDSVWLAVIAKSLASLCLRQAEKENASKFKGVLDKVQFLETLGLPQDAAAEAAGSSAASVAELRRQAKNKRAKGKLNAVKSKKKR